MYGNPKILWIGIAVGAAALVYALRASAGTGDGAPGSGDQSGGDSSGGGSSALGSALEGITDAAASIGYATGIYVSKGLRNNNPGNLRYVASIPWNGQVGDDGTGYAVFDTPEHGVRALSHQLQKYASRGINTVDDIRDASGRVIQKGIIPTFAPSTENDTAAYVADVCGRIGIAGDQPMDVHAMLVPLVDAIIHHENGTQPFSLDQLNVWCYEA